MPKYFQLLAVSISLLGCTVTSKDIEEIKLNADTTRVRVYQNHLRICGTFGVACGTAAESQQDRNVCMELMQQCTAEAEESYRIDTGKEPPGFDAQ